MLKINEFLAVATQLAFNAAEIIKATHMSTNIGQQMKGHDDPVTLADIRAQTHIVRVLNYYWPNLRIVGEESQQSEPEQKFAQIDKDRYSESLFDRCPQNTVVRTEYEINDLCVWVDPLDGTLAFVNGDLDQVTTLIGLTYKQLPIAGIIGQPYERIEGGYKFNPKVYFGHSQQKKVFYTYDVEQLIPYDLVRPTLNPKQKMTFAYQNHRISEEKLQQIQTLGEHNSIRISGSGRKTLLVLTGQADIFIYHGLKMSRWDICAGEALLNCFGGRICGLAGQQYTYDADLKDFYNPYGSLAFLHNDETIQPFISKTKAFL